MRCGTRHFNCRESSHTPVSLIENWRTRLVPSWSWDYPKNSSCITKKWRDRRAIAHGTALAATYAICNGVHLPGPCGAIRPTVARLRGVRRLPATQRWARILANLSRVRALGWTGLQLDGCADAAAATCETGKGRPVGFPCARERNAPTLQSSDVPPFVYARWAGVARARVALFVSPHGTQISFQHDARSVPAAPRRAAQCGFA